jgi:hypothetical protein
MNTVIICWGEGDYPPKPIGTADNPDDAKEWCQAQANHLAGEVLPLIEWQRFLSRGTGPATSHYKGDVLGCRFEIFTVGHLG